MSQAHTSEKLIRDLSTEVFTKWWPKLSDSEESTEITRNVYNVQLATEGIPGGAFICDVGAGWGAFSCVIKGLGFRSTMIDDFRDAGFYSQSDSRYQMQKHFDVTVVSRDVVAEGLGLRENSVDVITCFDSMEHWHNSPRKVFHEVVTALKPGGRFVLGGPNCVNLRKRVSTLLGTSRWTSMNDWYEQEVFRGHVREPSVADLLYIARDMGLTKVTTHGANFAGLANPRFRAITLLLDPLLKARPSLCSEIYLVGHKPGATSSK